VYRFKLPKSWPVRSQPSLCSVTGCEDQYSRLCTDVQSLFVATLKKRVRRNSIPTPHGGAEKKRAITKVQLPIRLRHWSLRIGKGRWPQSWDDVSEGNYARQYVQMRFDVNIDELVGDPILIQSAIVPVSGVYYTYPQAERQLNQLRDVLVRLHKR
jgi:hypothetical protein